MKDKQRVNIFCRRQLNLLEHVPTEKENFLWNMIGSLVYAVSSMLLSLFVIKIVGADEGGIFSIALTISQMLVYIAYFETRTYQVTDVENKFSFGEYHSTKHMLCIVMYLFCIGYVLIKDYRLDKAVVVLLVCFVRLLDGYADLYEAQFQKDGRLDLAGKSLAYRTIVFMFVLFFCLVVTKHLIFSMVVADFFAILGIIYFDINVMRRQRKLACSYHWAKIKVLIKECFPLFIGVFCWTYILSASRIAIDGNMESKYQAYYQLIFMPVSVINLFANFVFKPLLPKLSEEYSKGLYKKFYSLIIKGILWLIGITGICMLGAYVLGIPILSLLSGCDLTEYRGVLVFLIFAGGFNAISFTMYYVLSIMRESKSILINYLLAAAMALLISTPLVEYAGIEGAAFSYFLTVIVLCIILFISIMRRTIKDRAIL